MKIRKKLPKKILKSKIPEIFTQICHVCPYLIQIFSENNSGKKKAKNQNKVGGASVRGKKLKKFLNFMGGAADDESLNVVAVAPPSPADTKEVSSIEIVEKTRETKAVSASGRRANEFYLSKIQALEKVLVEMRKKKQKRKGQQSQECRFVFFWAIDRRRQHFKAQDSSGSLHF